MPWLKGCQQSKVAIEQGSALPWFHFLVWLSFFAVASASSMLEAPRGVEDWLRSSLAKHRSEVGIFRSKVTGWFFRRTPGKTHVAMLGQTGRSPRRSETRASEGAGDQVRRREQAANGREGRGGIVENRDITILGRFRGGL